MRRSQVVVTWCLLPLVSALSLANFQQISPNAVPILCLVTYNSPIASCTQADFEDGAACSDFCIAGLELINQAVDEACQGIKVSSSTLLGMVFQNTMVGALCPNSITTTTAVTSSTTVAPIVVPPEGKTTTSESSTSTSTTPIIVKTTSTTSEDKTTSTTFSTTFSTTSSAASTASTASTTKATTSSLAIDGTTLLSTTSTTTKPTATHHTHASELQQQIEAIKDTGGGSPFDILDSGSPMLLSGNSYRSILAASALMIGMFVAL